VFISRNLVTPSRARGGPENLIVLPDTDPVLVEHHCFPGLLSEDTGNAIRSPVAFFPGSQDPGIFDKGEKPPGIAVRIVVGAVVLHYHYVIFDKLIFDLRVDEEVVHWTESEKTDVPGCVPNTGNIAGPGLAPYNGPREPEPHGPGSLRSPYITRP